MSKTWLQMAPNVADSPLTRGWTRWFPDVFSNSGMMKFSVIVEEPWRSLRWLCQAWQMGICLFAFSYVLFLKPWKEKIIYVSSHIMVIWYVQPIFSQKIYAERSDRLLLVFYSKVLTGERRCVMLFKELNLVIMPSPIRYNGCRILSPGTQFIRKKVK